MLDDDREFSWDEPSSELDALQRARRELPDARVTAAYRVDVVSIVELGGN